MVSFFITERYFCKFQPAIPYRVLFRLWDFSHFAPLIQAVDRWLWWFCDGYHELDNHQNDSKWWFQNDNHQNWITTKELDNHQNVPAIFWWFHDQSTVFLEPHFGGCPTLDVPLDGRRPTHNQTEKKKIYKIRYKVR